MTLAAHRSELGLTLEQTAQQLGLKPSSKSWLSDIENGKRPASIRLALKIERWSGGKVTAASVCPELADHEAPKAVDDADTLPTATAPGALEKSGDVQ